MKNFKIVKRSLAVFVSMAMACSMAGVSAAAEGIHATSSIASYTAQQDGFLIENDVLISYTGNDEHVVIPDGVTKIGEGAFNKNKTLVSVHIPDSVTVIGEYAFNSCDKLKNVDIPSHLESVGMSAFSNTIWGKNHPTFISGTTLFGTGYAIGCVVIPDGVTKIGDNAFSECMYLSSVHIPDTVTAIGENAFESCIQLFTISIPKSVSSIGKGAFSGCCNLSRITIPEGITRIEDFTFHGCTYLETVNIPNTVTSIGEWAFRSCRNLTSIEFPNSITNIENPEHQFDGCDKLTTIYGTAGSYAETFAKKYGYQFISNTSTQKFDIQDGTLVKYTGTAKNVVIPDGVTKIGAHAFENCTQVRTVHIPDGVTAIEDYAFSGCNNLTTINIPNSVIKLGEFAFYLCFDLNNLSIPESVTDIGMYTFSYFVLICNFMPIKTLFGSFFANFLLNEKV